MVELNLDPTTQMVVQIVIGALFGIISFGGIKAVRTGMKRARARYGFRNELRQRAKDEVLAKREARNRQQEREEDERKAAARDIEDLKWRLRDYRTLEPGELDLVTAHGMREELRRVAGFGNRKKRLGAWRQRARSPKDAEKLLLSDPEFRTMLHTLRADGVKLKIRRRNGYLDLYLVW